MRPPPNPTTSARSRPPGPRLLTSLVVIGVGLVVGVVSVVAIAIPLVGAFTSPAYAVPGDLHVHLHHARYTVYQHSGTRSTFGPFTSDRLAIGRIDPSALSVTASDGTNVPVSDDANVETLTCGSAVYTGTLVFNVPADGEYDLAFTNSNATTVVVARSLSDALHDALGWFAAGALGAAVVVGGVAMLIVGATRRGRAKRAGYGGWGAPPPWGWPGPRWGPGPPPPPAGPPPGPGVAPPPG